MRRVGLLLLLICAPVLAQDLVGEGALPGEAEIQRVLRFKRLAAMPKYAQPLLSRRYCEAKARADEAGANIADYQERIRKAGVFPDDDTRADMIYQEGEIKQGEADAKDWLSVFKKRRLKPLPCDCIERMFNCERWDSNCYDHVKAYELVWAAGESVIRGDEPSPPAIEEPEPNNWPSVCANIVAKNHAKAQAQHAAR